MTQLERLAQNIIFGSNGEDIKKVISTITNGGVVGVNTIIRWKDSGEICQRDIAISKHETTEDFWFDEDFLFNVNNVPQFLALLANLDFTMSEFDTEEEWLEEIHKYEDEDKDDYFHSGEDFDVIDVIGKYFIEPDQFDEPMIGTKKVVEGGVKYTPDSTDNGYVFKDYNAIKNRKGVCYIAECGFDNGDLILTPDNTWKEIEDGAVVTYESARQQVRDLVHSMFPKFAATANFDLYQGFIEKITDYILEEVDWCCFSTMLNEMDLDEELDYYLQDKFVEYMQANLPDEYEEFRDRLFGYFGETCYRDDDYALTDWSALLTEWVENH